MIRMTDRFRGFTRIEAVGTFPTGLLNRCAQAKIVFWDTEPADAYTLRLTIRTRDLRRVQELGRICRCSVKVLFAGGTPSALARLRRRAVMAIGLVACLGLLMWSSLYIWDMEVIGEETVSEAEILAALDKAGVRIGSFWPDFTSDSIRSLVLAEMPELRWMTVNVRGSRAEVIVRERIQKPEIVDENAPTDVVAEKTGIITEMRVLWGQPIAVQGQTVLGGETLVSGMTTNGFAPAQAEHAMAEVWARTWYELTAVSPLSGEQKIEGEREKNRWALKIGGRRINFYAGSGILGANCDKIKKEYQLAVPGLFVLPVSLVRESLTPYDTVTVSPDTGRLQAELETSLREQLIREIGPEGEILSPCYTAVEADGLLYVTLRAECRERIDMLRPLETGE